jgi:hypothetical protein
MVLHACLFPGLGNPTAGSLRADAQPTHTAAAEHFKSGITSSSGAEVGAGSAGQNSTVSLL